MSDLRTAEAMPAPGAPVSTHLAWLASAFADTTEQTIAIAREKAETLSEFIAFLGKRAEAMETTLASIRRTLDYGTARDTILLREASRPEPCAAAGATSKAPGNYETALQRQKRRDEVRRHARDQRLRKKPDAGDGGAS